MTAVRAADCSATPRCVSVSVGGGSPQRPPAPRTPYGPAAPLRLSPAPPRTAQALPHRGAGLSGVPPALDTGGWGMAARKPPRLAVPPRSDASADGGAGLRGEPLLGADSSDAAPDADANGDSGGPAGAKVWLKSGTMALWGVAFLWGTYTPLLRYLYAIDGAPSPSMLTAVRGVLGTIVLGISWLLSKEARQAGPDEEAGKAKGEGQGGGETPAPMLPGAPVMLPGAPERPAFTGLRLWVYERMTTTTSKLWLAGAEMGMWNFLGTSLQAIGLEYTTATRAAFIIQSTALFTPLISSLAGERLTQATYMGCTFAMMGTLLVTAEHSGNPASHAMLSSSLIGDLCVLASALFYACTTVRLGLYANKFQAVKFAASKMLMLCIISMGWLALEVVEGVGHGISPASMLLSRWESYNDPACWLWVVFSALGPGALAAYLQTVGQATATPSQSQIIYSSVPLWSALLAVVVLREQPMGMLGWAGGLFIIAGGFFAAEINKR
eukprot:jgi/Tetstr1/437001/TSEL_002740.t1